MFYWYKDGIFHGESHIQSIADNKRTVLFGASKKNEFLLKKLDKGSISCIFDNDERKWNTDQESIPIVKPCRGIENAVLVSAVYDWKTLCSQIEALGYNEIYFFLPEKDEPYLKKYISFFAPRAEKNIVLENTIFPYIHIIPDEKFFMSVIEFIEYGLNMNEHFFLIYGINGANRNDDYNIWNKYDELLQTYHNIYLLHDKNREFNLYNWEENKCRMDKLLEHCKKIIFHGEWFTDNIFEYFCSKTELVKRKGVFIPWAGKAGRNPKTYHFIEGVLQYSKMVVSSNVFIEENLRRIFPRLTDAIWFDHRFSYARLTKNVCEKHKNTRNIFIAHCAHDYAKPMDSLKYMRGFDKSCHIYCITSYGGRKQEIESYGREYFGSRFTPIGNYMSYDEYVEFLSKMDIAVIGMENMAGRDTLELLFWLGVKVYLKPESEAYKRMDQFGYRLYDYYSARDEDIDQLFDNKEAKHNRMRAAEEFDPEVKLSQWRALYEYDFEKQE